MYCMHEHTLQLSGLRSSVDVQMRRSYCRLWVGRPAGRKPYTLQPKTTSSWACLKVSQQAPPLPEVHMHVRQGPVGTLPGHEVRLFGSPHAPCLSEVYA